MKLTSITTFFILLASLSYSQGNEPNNEDSLLKTRGFYVNDTLVNYREERCWALSVKADTTNILVNREFGILNAQIINKHLNLEFTYGGGCGPVYLRLYVNESINIYNDPVIELFPEFIDKDPCKALRFGTSNFDINGLIAKRKKPLIIKVWEYKLNVPN